MTGTWQDNIWCPINIILLCTSDVKLGCPRGVFCPSSIPSEHLFLCERRKFGFNEKTCKNFLIVCVYYQPKSCTTHAEREWAGGSFLREQKKFLLPTRMGCLYQKNILEFHTYTMKTATPWLWGGINGLYMFSLLCHYATLTAVATKTKPIDDNTDRRFMIILNSASTAAPIGLLPKMAKFCHTSNRLLLGHQCRHAQLRLYFNSSATSRSVGQSVHNKGCWVLGGFPPKG